MEILQSCKHHNYVTDFDKKELAEDIRCPLDRQHMKYLLLMDPILVMFQKQKELKIFISPFFQGFGLIQIFEKSTIKSIHAQIEKFHKIKGEAIYVFFIGATAHWVTFIVHKSKDGQLKFYLLDSSNLEYLDCPEELIPACYDRHLHQLLESGIPRKSADFDHFGTKMSLHSLIDLRRTFQMFQHIFKNKESLVHVYCQQYLHVKLKHFWNYTKEYRDMCNKDVMPPTDAMMTGSIKQIDDGAQKTDRLMRAKDVIPGMLNYDASLYKEEWTMNTFLYSYFRIPEANDP